MKVVNVRDYGGLAKAIAAGVVYVGRPTVLGNPYTHLGGVPGTIRVASRAVAIRKYRRWLHEKLEQRDVEVIAALDRLNETDFLGCWCMPQACHAEIIIAAWEYRRRTIDHG
jgi:hypothetical protein